MDKPAAGSAVAAIGVSPDDQPMQTAEKHGLIPERLKGAIQLIMVGAVLIVLFIFFSITANNFATPANIQNLLSDSMVIGVQAVGLTFVIATGGIDLTPGYGMAATSVIGVLLMTTFGLPIWLGAILCLAAGALLGLINGTLIARIKMQPMIATLSMMLVCWGTGLVLSNNGKMLSTRGDYAAYTNIAEYLIPLPGGFNLPSGVLIMLAAAVIAGILMNKTVVGRYALAIGSNKEATRISGIKTVRWEIVAYVMCGIFTGLSGLLMSSHLSGASATTGASYEMYAIAAAVIGGTSLRGGRASVFGAVIGAITIKTIFNGLTMLGVEDMWQKIILGATVLFAVFIDIMRRGGKEE
jgi:ribose transport system permease protein